MKAFVTRLSLEVLAYSKVRQGRLLPKLSCDASDTVFGRYRDLTDISI